MTGEKELVDPEWESFDIDAQVVKEGGMWGDILGSLLGTRDTYTMTTSTAATVALGLVLVAALAVLVWAVNGMKVKR